MTLTTKHDKSHEIGPSIARKITETRLSSGFEVAAVAREICCLLSISKAPGPAWEEPRHQYRYVLDSPADESGHRQPRTACLVASFSLELALLQAELDRGCINPRAQFPTLKDGRKAYFYQIIVTYGALATFSTRAQ
jgi:hypothetical protein